VGETKGACGSAARAPLEVVIGRGDDEMLGIMEGGMGPRSVLCSEATAPLSDRVSGNSGTDVEAAKAGRGSDSELAKGEIVAFSAGPCVARAVAELGGSGRAAGRLFSSVTSG
jgi:hypothetical protein